MSTFAVGAESEQPEGQPATSAITSKPSPRETAFQISCGIPCSFERGEDENRSKRVQDFV